MIDKHLDKSTSMKDDSIFTDIDYLCHDVFTKNTAERLLKIGFVINSVTVRLVTFWNSVETINMQNLIRTIWFEYDSLFPQLIFDI
jgi:hypothetical protein